MAKLEFNDLSFVENSEDISVFLLKYFTFIIPKKELAKIGEFKIGKNSIDFKNTNNAQNKFNFLISSNIINLKNVMTNRPAIYIHKNSRIPLIGSNYFGIVDRGTSLIEIKPLNSCNLNCIYCSVDEGPNSKSRLLDFVVEKDYLIEELKKVVEFKDSIEIEVHIGTQGEPLLYGPIINLIKDIKKIKKVKIISMDTNGVLLTEKIVDEMIKAGLSRFNLSINAIDQKIAEKLAGSTYQVDKIIKIAKYIAKKGDLILTPVLVPEINEKEIPKLIEFAKKIGAGKTAPAIGIQNFLSYRYGRNPAKQISFDDFYEKLKVWEKKYKIRLITDLEEDFKIKKTNEIPKPFKKGEVISAKIMCKGRLFGEMLAVAGDRIISIPSCHKTGSVKLKIVRSKHNIFVAKLL